MVRTTALIALVAAVAAAPLAYAQANDAPWKKRVISSVGPMQKRMTSAAGEMVLLLRPEFLVPGVRVEEDVPPPPQIAGKFEMAKGTVLTRAESAQVFKACTEGGRYGDPCLFDDDGDGMFDRAAKGMVSKGHPLPKKIPYSSVGDVSFPANSGIEARLIYQGGTGQSLRFSYREFIDSYAREPFTEEIEIPLGATFPQDFAVKGAVFRLYGVGPMGIDYSVESYRYPR